MAKKTFGKRALALLMALLLCCSTMNLTAHAARDDDREEGNWSYAYYLGQEYLGNAPGASTKPDPVGYGFQGVITSLTFTDDAGTQWTFRWSSEANGEWRITGRNVSREKASAWPQITDGKVYTGYCGGTAYTFTLENDGSSKDWTYARDGHANWFRYIRFIRRYTVNVFYQNETGSVSYQGVTYAQADPIKGSFTFYYPNGSIIDDSEYRDGEYTEPTTLMPEDYLPQSKIDQGYEIKHATDARGNDVTTTGVTISLLGSNVLNVYCTLIPPATEDYKVEHHYYLEGKLEGEVSGGTIQVESGSDFANVVAGIEKLPVYEGNTYGYTGYEVDPGKKVITLRYNRVRPTYDYAVTYHANFDPNETVADAENALGVTDAAKVITVDANPFTRPGYAFQGWATEPEGGVVYQAEDKLSFELGGEEELFAVWQAIPTYDYCLIYNANFGANETKADAENALGVYDTTKAIGIDQNPFTRPGYTFQGWATEPEGGVVYAPGMSLIFTLGGQEELFAVWQAIPTYDYAVTYNANFGEVPEVRADSENILGVYDLSWDIGVDGNRFVRENYTFIGWNTAPDGSGTAYAPGDELALTADNNTEVLYARWQENPKYDYAVTYNANFGANETKADAENVSGVYDLSRNIGVDANSFVRENYIFTGWNTAPDGSGTPYTTGNIVALTAQDNTAILYAQWEELPKYDYTVTYYANFGENAFADDAENALQVYDTAKTITVDENTFLRENYDFLGWATEPNGTVAYLSGDAINFELGGSEELYALWAEHDKYSYTVVYNGNGGALADGTLAYGDAENVADVYETEKTFTVDANLFIREHYTFLGWNTASDGSGIGYTAQQALLLTAGDNTCTLYAQWQEHPKYDYAVIYNANFGEAPAMASDAENVLQVYDTAKTIGVDGNVFLREHYTFLGWATEPAGQVVYAPGDEIVFRLGGQEELFALWQLNEYAYTVEYMVRIDDGQFQLYTGTLPEGSVTGGVLPYGTVVDEAIVAPPAALDGDGFRFAYIDLEPIVIAESGNVVRVYYQYNTPAEIDDDPPTPPTPPDKPNPPDEPDPPQDPDDDPPVVDIPDEDVPLADVPKTGDPMVLYASLTILCGGGALWLKGKKDEEE